MSSLTTVGRRIQVATSSSAEAPLEIREVEARPLGARDVRVKVHAIGVNPVDWKMRAGGPLRLAHRFLGPSGPLIVGIDFSGEVVEKGSSADLEIGTRVVGGTDFSRGQIGSYATEVVVRDDQCAKLSDDVSYEDAACLPVPGATAMRAFEVAKLDRKSPSDVRVLVLGASGGVGLITVQLVKAMGATAVGVCSARNVALVESYGAIVVDYTKGDALEQAKAHGPFDLILHAVGTDLYPLGKCRSLLKPGGLVALAVVNPGDVPSMLFLPSVKSVLGRPGRKNLEPLAAALAKGDIKALIEKKFPLSEAEEAHKLSKAGKVVGKLLLTP